MKIRFTSMATLLLYVHAVIHGRARGDRPLALPLVLL